MTLYFHQTRPHIKVQNKKCNSCHSRYFPFPLQIHFPPSPVVWPLWPPLKGAFTMASQKAGGQWDRVVIFQLSLCYALVENGHIPLPKATAPGRPPSPTAPPQVPSVPGVVGFCGFVPSLVGFPYPVHVFVRVPLFIFPCHLSRFIDTGIKYINTKIL